MAFDSSLPDGSVRYFTPDSRMLRRKLRAKLQERVKEHLTHLGCGNAPDFADYRYRCGQLQALNEAIEICEQLEKDEDR